MAVVLLIEDEVGISDFVRRGLESAGFTVVVAADGLSGLTHAQHDDVELVILDLGLPGLPGEQVLARLRTVRPAVPVIVLTAKGAVQDRVTNLEAGANDYVVKPLSFSELLARVRVQLRRPEQSSSVLLEGGGLTLDVRTREVSVDGGEHDLVVARVHPAGGADAPPRAGAVADPAVRPGVGLRLRRRVERRRDLRAPPATQDRRRPDPDRAAGRVPAGARVRHSLYVRIALIALTTLAVTMLAAALLTAQLIRVEQREDLDEVLRREVTALALGLPDQLSEAAGADGTAAAAEVDIAVQRYLALHPGSQQHLTVVTLGTRTLSTQDGPPELVDLSRSDALPRGTVNRLLTVGSAAGPLRVLTTDVVSQGQAIAQVSVFGPLGPSLDSAQQAFTRIALASAIGLVLGGVVLLVALRRALLPVHGGAFGRPARPEQPRPGTGGPRRGFGDRGRVQPDARPDPGRRGPAQAAPRRDLARAPYAAGRRPRAPRAAGDARSGGGPDGRRHRRDRSA